MSVSETVLRAPATVVRRLREHARAFYRDLSSVERGLLLAVLVLHGFGFWWGLPASEGWDVDGIAPRDFLPGVAKTFTPGDYFTYPPLHLVLLSVLTLPVTLVQVLRAPSLRPEDLVLAFIDVRVMTAFAVVARLVNLVMSVGIVHTMGRLSAIVFGRRARPWTFAVAGVEAACTYYGHTSNLDIPAFFWASLALLALAEAIQQDDETRLRRVGVLAAMAIATKDQAYAVFAVSMPLALGAWVVLRARRGSAPGMASLARRVVVLGVTTAGLTLLFDGALFNPTGFLARVRFLTGHASQDFAQYANDWAGRGAALSDALLFLPLHYPWLVGALFAAGLAFALAGVPPRDRGPFPRLVALVPAFGMLSFTLAFNCVARRVEERFMLPQMQLLAVYAGGGVATMVTLAEERRAAWGVWLARALGAAAILLGLRLSLTVLVNMLEDPRYDAEAWVAAHTKPGDVIEVYGGNVYLPRFPSSLVVERIGPTAPRSRNPMPGIVERQDAFTNIVQRNPRLAVFSQCFVWRYVQPKRGEDQGRIMPEAQRAVLEEVDATTHFRSLFDNQSPYRLAYMAQYKETKLFPRRLLHGSLGCEVWVFAKPL